LATLGAEREGRGGTNSPRLTPLLLVFAIGCISTSCFEYHFTARTAVLGGSAKACQMPDVCGDTQADTKLAEHAESGSASVGHPAVIVSDEQLDASSPVHVAGDLNPDSRHHRRERCRADDLRCSQEEARDVEEFRRHLRGPESVGSELRRRRSSDSPAYRVPLTGGWHGPPSAYPGLPFLPDLGVPPMARISPPEKRNNDDAGVTVIEVVNPTFNPDLDAGVALPSLSALEDFFAGYVGFDVPPRMRQGRHTPVQVSLARLQSVVEQSFPAQDTNVQVSPQKLSRVVSVSLYGPTFEVMPPSSERQAILDDGPSTWLFDVLPLEAGQQQLTLRVDAMLVIPNHPGEVPRTERTIRLIIVEVDRAYQAETFVKKNWQWSLVPTIGGVLAWGLNQWRGWRKKKRQRSIGFNV
jgi:hypothetical protein